MLASKLAGILLQVYLTVLPPVLGQLSADELAPLLSGLAERPRDADLEARVPLMTDDPTVAPLVDLQVFAPPVVPEGGSHCAVELSKHSFGVGSYGAPAVVPYIPPAADGCGEIGKWAAISLNLSSYSIGTQYDRLSAIYLSNTEIWRHSSAEPTRTGTIWNTVKDVTHFTPLFAQKGDLMMDFSNIIAPELLLDGVFDVVLTATFYAATASVPTPQTADLIVPLSNLSPTLPNFFTIDNDLGAVTNISLPEDSIEAFVEIFCSGNSAEEFWYLNTPDDFVPYFPASTGVIGKGPFREVQVLVDGKLAGVVWPYPVIYTGGITPSNWRPLASYGAYDAPTYWIDITPFLPTLLDGNASHSVTLRVLGQGKEPTINSNWFVSGSIHVRRGSSRTTGRMTRYEVPDLQSRTLGAATAGNETVWTQVDVSRELSIESELVTSEGTRTVTFTQSLRYTNEARYADEGWVQWVNQSTIGTTSSTHGGVTKLRDAFEYPLAVFSNYSLYTAEFGSYGSDIHQTHTRALQPPLGATYRSIHSVQHAQGQIGMDNWPGLRHAINGTGTTDQLFAYVDERGETYFRDIMAKNDGWVRDKVWGTLRDRNPPVPRNQIFGPEGGPGFRRMIAWDTGS
ncbi:putative peptide-N4-(N-acetyl-beta-glucosaminyl)asparagine amidase A [Lyophyllum shimeji]|uniref:Peptide-N4-(N-acetyl-beta-glucosaminyl)asparagine amidase A n=1 Tax=Lyophyllum shimeji TaxID=47721 RepID=A0A9P3UMQ7_LYOSH|nr:putative peptide-N4-(N-acetyl-beta-glucosaminyl)asparagine amidase A [Lyophyllum shimeji]